MTTARINKNGVPAGHTGPPPAPITTCRRAFELVDGFNLSLSRAAEVLAAEGKGTGPDGKTRPHKSTVADWVQRGREDHKKHFGKQLSRRKPARTARGRRLTTMRATTYDEFLAGNVTWAEAAAVFRWLEREEAQLTGSDKPARSRVKAEGTLTGQVRVMDEDGQRAVLGEDPPEPP